MGMKTSNKGLAHLAASEGIVVAPYKDSVGVMTYGIGHTANAGGVDPKTMTKGNPVNIDEAIKNAISLFAVDIVKYEDRVNDAVNVDLKQHEFDALVSFDYNTGGIYKASFVKKLNAGDIEGAIAGFMSWSKPPEIIPRRRSEQFLFGAGQYGGHAINVWGVRSGDRVDWSKPLKTITPEQLANMMASKKPFTPSPKTGGIAALVTVLLAALVAKLDEIQTFIGGLF